MLNLQTNKQVAGTTYMLSSVTQLRKAASKHTQQFEEQLFCRNGSIEYRQTISVDNAKSGTNFNNGTTQAGIAIEISQQQHYKTDASQPHVTADH